MTPDLLLDSHVVIGALVGDKRFGKKTRQLIASSRQLFFSPLSIAELALKASLKKAPDLSPHLATDLLDLGLVELPLVSDAARGITGIPALHPHDPFDRLLLAQARHHNLLFITADRALVELELDFVHDAFV